jgi:hypothetical protein
MFGAHGSNMDTESSVISVTDNRRLARRAWSYGLRLGFGVGVGFGVGLGFGVAVGVGVGDGAGFTLITVLALFTFCMPRESLTLSSAT